MAFIYSSMLGFGKFRIGNFFPVYFFKYMGRKIMAPVGDGGHHVCQLYGSGLYLSLPDRIGDNIARGPTALPVYTIVIFPVRDPSRFARWQIIAQMGTQSNTFHMFFPNIHTFPRGRELIIEFTEYPCGKSIARFI